MVSRKRLLRVTAVLSVAFATGQAVESLRASSAAADGSVSELRVLNDRVPSSASLYPGEPGNLPDILGITAVAAATERAESDRCTPTMVLSAAEGAMIDLDLRAPCDAGERVVIRHSGLSFTGLMGLDGRLALSLPALAREALVAAYFEGSAVALAKVVVPDAGARARFAFQIPYPVDFQLRAEDGDTIHVGGIGGPGWTPSSRIMTLGSEAVAQPIIAQVYTFRGFDLGSSKLSVEVRITDQICSRSFVAETRISQGGGVTAQSLPIAVPMCGSAGDILVLKNLVPDPTLAAPR